MCQMFAAQCCYLIEKTLKYTKICFQTPLLSSSDTNNLSYEGLAKSDLIQFLNLKQTIQKALDN